MSGDERQIPERGAKTALLRRPAALAAIATTVAVAAAAGAWLTRPELRPAASPSTAQPEQTAKVATAPVQEATAPPPAAQPPQTPPAPAGPAPTPGEKPSKMGAAASGEASTPVDWPNLPIGALRAKAEAGDVPGMEELGRRLLQGVGVPKDQQAGAGWLLRAAQAGSAQSAFNVGVMYERGFVVERDSARAVEWYRKAVDADLPVAKHNLALMLREGKGTARNGKEAIELLRSAALQGMSASMFSLGDMYERGDATTKDLASALAWFAITGEFERQTHKDGETTLGRTAAQRAQAVQRVLSASDLERAQEVSQREFKQIVEALQPPKPPEPAPAPAPASPATKADTPVVAQEALDLSGWPKGPVDQVRVVQQALFDLKLLRDKPDGAIGPMTRNAIRTFQRGAGLRETGEATRDVFIALKEAVARRDGVASPPESKPTAEAKSTATPPAGGRKDDLKGADAQTAPAPVVAKEKEEAATAPAAEASKPATDAQADARKEATSTPPASDPKPAAPVPAESATPAQTAPAVPSTAATETAKPDEPKAAPPDTATPQPAASSTQTAGAATQPQAEPPKPEPVRPEPAIAAAVPPAGASPSPQQGNATTPGPGASTAGAAPAGPAAAPGSLAAPAPRDNTSAPERRAAAPSLPAAPVEGGGATAATEPAGTGMSASDAAKPSSAAGPLTLAAPPRLELPRDLPKPPMPRIEGAKPTSGGAPAPVATADKPAQPPLEIGTPSAAPLPPTSNDIARFALAPDGAVAAPDPTAWPAGSADQVKAIQTLLRDLNFYRETPDGLLGPATKTAIRDYEKLAGLKITGEPSKAVFDSLVDLRQLMGPKPAGN